MNEQRPTKLDVQVKVTTHVDAGSETAQAQRARAREQRGKGERTHERKRIK